MIQKAKITQRIKFKLGAGEAKNAPPLGPILGQNQISPQNFISTFNEITSSFTPGLELNVQIVKFNDRSTKINYTMPSIHHIVEELIFPIYNEKNDNNNDDTVQENLEKVSVKGRSIKIEQFYDIIQLHKQFLKKKLTIKMKLYTLNPF